MCVCAAPRGKHATATLFRHVSGAAAALEAEDEEGAISRLGGGDLLQVVDEVWLWEGRELGFAEEAACEEAGCAGGLAGEEVGFDVGPVRVRGWWCECGVYLGSMISELGG